MSVEIRFEDLDGDGDREVVVENPWLRAVLRFPEQVGEEYYGRRFTWGGRMQSLVYKPTRREHFMTEMLDPEDVRPFGLPDELFASFPLAPGPNGEPGELKMGVGVTRTSAGVPRLEPLPWTWHEEKVGAETVVVFRQEEEVEQYSYVYEKRYRFRPDAAWFAMDVVWENRGETALESDWDIHSFHVSGAPPNSSWMVAPKRAWVSFGNTRLRTVLKEASAIFSTPDENQMVADLIDWSLDREPWWYALGPGDGDEFYLLRARFEPCRGLWWTAWEAFTPQGINHVEVPAGDRAVWGFDVTLGRDGRNFVCAGEDCGLTLDRRGSGVSAALHAAGERSGRLEVTVVDQKGGPHANAAAEGGAGPQAALEVDAALPAEGEYATVEAVYREGDRTLLHANELVALEERRPTAHLPADTAGLRVLIGSHHDAGLPHTDGLFLYSHALESGCAATWEKAGELSADPAGYEVICLVGDAWPPGQASMLREWVDGGGGLLVCAPFGDLSRELDDLLPLQPLGPGSLQAAEPPLGLKAGARHWTSDRLMLHPDGEARVGFWTPARAAGQAVVSLCFDEPGCHPAVAVAERGGGRVAGCASRPAWGTPARSAIWSGWGQYHRSLFAGLIAWLGRRDSLNEIG